MYTHIIIVQLKTHCFFIAEIGLQFLLSFRALGRLASASVLCTLKWLRIGAQYANSVSICMYVVSNRPPHSTSTWTDISDGHLRYLRALFDCVTSIARTASIDRATDRPTSYALLLAMRN